MQAEARRAPNEGLNNDARQLCERLGYKVVGTLTDHIAWGHSEILLRKTHGPLAGFTARSPGE